MNKLISSIPACPAGRHLSIIHLLLTCIKNCYLINIILPRKKINMLGFSFLREIRER